MESLTEEPQTINAQLRELPAYQALLAHKPESEPFSLTGSSIAAGLMQFKDSVAILILLSNGYLIFGIVWGFGIPGLVLYWLRWRQVRGRTGRSSIIAQAVFSLLHELLWVSVFYGQRTASEPLNCYEACIMLYSLGALLSLAQLLVAVTDSQDEAYQDSLSDEQ